MKMELAIDLSPQQNLINEPVPDLVVLTIPFHQFPSQNPGPGHLRLVIEVSDSSAAYDLRIKAGLYARAAIVEYWVVDMAKRQIVVHREPSGGRYTSKTVYAEDESLSPLGCSGSLVVSSILPKV